MMMSESLRATGGMPVELTLTGRYRDLNPAIQQMQGLIHDYNTWLDTQVQGGVKFTLAMDKYAGTLVLSTHDLLTKLKNVETVLKPLLEGATLANDGRRVFNREVFPLWNVCQSYESCPSRIPLDFTGGWLDDSDIELHVKGTDQYGTWQKVPVIMSPDRKSLDTRQWVGRKAVAMRKTRTPSLTDLNIQDHESIEQGVNRIYRIVFFRLMETLFYRYFLYESLIQNKATETDPFVVKEVEVIKEVIKTEYVKVGYDPEDYRSVVRHLWSQGPLTMFPVDSVLMSGQWSQKSLPSLLTVQCTTFESEPNVPNVTPALGQVLYSYDPPSGGGTTDSGPSISHLATHYVTRQAEQVSGPLSSTRWIKMTFKHYGVWNGERWLTLNPVTSVVHPQAHKTMASFSSVSTIEGTFYTDNSLFPGLLVIPSSRGVFHKNTVHFLNDKNRSEYYATPEAVDLDNSGNRPIVLPFGVTHNGVYVGYGIDTRTPSPNWKNSRIYQRTTGSPKWRGYTLAFMHNGGPRDTEVTVNEPYGTRTVHFVMGGSPTT